MSTFPHVTLALHGCPAPLRQCRKYDGEYCDIDAGTPMFAWEYYAAGM